MMPFAALTSDGQITPTTLTSVLAWLPTVIVGIGAVVVALRKLIPNFADTWIESFGNLRRASDQVRDGELDGLRARIDGLDRLVHEQQLAIDRHQAVINDLRYDLSDTRAYGWEAYTEIRRLDPDTTFRKPPQPRTVIPEPPQIVQSPPAPPPAGP